ncbi:MAG: roadblock/LC7 domain-containing protein [Planctomycetota bacterium]
MRDILKRLEGAVGVLGSLVMTRDGVLASSCVVDAATADRVAAFASTVLRSVERKLPHLGAGRVRRITMLGRRGRLLFVPIDECVLVIIADKDTDLEFTLMEIAGLANRLEKRGRINV